MSNKEIQIPAKLTGIRLRQLQLFALAAEVGSISEAARRSNVTQPTATEMLQELERAFSTQLFIRGAKGIVLTAPGRRVASGAASALRELQWAASEAASTDKGFFEVLRVGFVPTALNGDVSRALQLFLDETPGVRLILRQLNVPDSVQALLQGELDIAITTNHPSFSEIAGRENVHLNALILDHHTVFISSRLDLGEGWIATPESLRRLSWILPARESFIRGVFDDWFFRQGVDPPEPAVEIYPMTSAVELLKTMPYATLLPEGLVGNDGATHLVQIGRGMFDLPARLIIACKEHQAERPAVRNFIHCVVQTCGVSA